MIMALIIGGAAIAVITGLALVPSEGRKREENSPGIKGPVFDEFFRSYRAPGGLESFQESVRAAERDGKSEAEWTSPGGSSFVVEFCRERPDANEIRIDSVRRAEQSRDA